MIVEGLAFLGGLAVGVVAGYVLHLRWWGFGVDQTIRRVVAVEVDVAYGRGVRDGRDARLALLSEETLARMWRGMP